MPDNEEDESEEDDDPEPEFATPECWMGEAEVESASFQYSERALGDWVISGPLHLDGPGPGRRFPSWDRAEEWARRFYGARLRGRIVRPSQIPAYLDPDDYGRWAFLIRGSRGDQ